MTAENASQRSVDTDENGQFECKELPAGRYQVRASLVGYVPLEFRDMAPGYAVTYDAGSTDVANAQPLHGAWAAGRGVLRHRRVAAEERHRLAAPRSFSGRWRAGQVGSFSTTASGRAWI